MQNAFERRFLAAEVRVTQSEAGNPVVGGNATATNTYELWPGMTERMAPGAFATVLAAIGLDCRGQLNHDPNFVFARTTVPPGPGHLEVWEDETGLRWEAELDPSDPDTAKVVSKVKSGVVSQCSFMFRVERDSVTTLADGSQHRDILEVGELLDVGPVTFPANPGTSVQSVRSVADIDPRFAAEARGLIGEEAPPMGDEDTRTAEELAAEEAAVVEDAPVEVPAAEEVREDEAPAEAAAEEPAAEAGDEDDDIEPVAEDEGDAEGDEDDVPAVEEVEPAAADAPATESNAAAGGTEERGVSTAAVALEGEPSLDARVSQERQASVAAGTAGTLAARSIDNEKGNTMDNETRGMLGQYLQRGDAVEAEVREALTTTSAGATIPEFLATTIAEAREKANFVRQLAKVITTATDGNLLLSASPNEAVLVTEGSAADKDLDMTADIPVRVPFGSHILKYTQEYSDEFLQDDPANIEGTFASNAGKGMSKAELRYFLVGTGVGQPQGILTATPSIRSFDVTSYNAWVDLDEAMEDEYVDGAVFVMGKSGRAAVRKVRDADGQPILVDAKGGNGGQTLFGKPIHTSAHVPAGLVALVNFDAAYSIVDRSQGNVAKRIETEDGIKAILKERTDGRIMDRKGLVVATAAV